MYSDRGAGSRKRSVKDRLGTNTQNGDEQSRSKRFQVSDGKWRHDMYDVNKGRAGSTSEQISSQDLRFQLQKSVSRGAQSGTDGQGGIKDLREKLSGPISVSRTHTQSVSMPQPRSSSAAKATSSAITTAPVSKPPAAAMVKPRAPSVKPPALAVKPPTPPIKPSPPMKVSTGAIGMTIATFLQSLDLSKYLITFQAEEIDMSVLRVMKEDELKELGIPMGPRKKIFLALAAQAKS